MRTFVAPEARQIRVSTQVDPNALTSGESALKSGGRSVAEHQYRQHGTDRFPEGLAEDEGNDPASAIRTRPQHDRRAEKPVQAGPVRRTPLDPIMFAAAPP